MIKDTTLPKFALPKDVADILSACRSYVLAHNVAELVEMSVKDAVSGWHDVAYEVPGDGSVLEARVCRVQNGIAANYIDPYMRRRDPDCMVIADNLPTNKMRFKDRFDTEFDALRAETFAWLKQQDLVVFPFIAGAPGKGMDAVVVAPANAGFFALGVAMLQGIIDANTIDEKFNPKAVIYVAPPFRHSHFAGRQVVVHHRSPQLYELFSYNLYPGPSAKKGIYGMLIDLGEKENWITAHCSTVQVITPYDNRVTIMHEGASGGGKSEMLEHVQRQRDGRLLLGRNLVTHEESFLVLPRTCDLHPVVDDMALCHPSLQKHPGKLTVMDAEDSWFMRVDQINHYGVDPHLEEMTIHPSEPLLFLNINATPGSTALIWDHVEDSPGKRCPNPRVVIPRKMVPDVVSGGVRVDIRSFGVRTPPCTKENPTYGIVGLLHIMPPALAWLWRLVAPRGHGNPSIVHTGGMASEGVGSYWPFATGRRVDQANLMLKQFVDYPQTRYILCPNQNIGAWQVGFMPQWIAREYLARRGGALFNPEQLVPARSKLLGYAFRSLMTEGQSIPSGFLRVDKQPEVGQEGYDEGDRILTEFFHKQLRKFLEPDLAPLGRKIIDCCLEGGNIADFLDLIQAEPILAED